MDENNQNNQRSNREGRSRIFKRGKEVGSFRGGVRPSKKEITDATKPKKEP